MCIQDFYYQKSALIYISNQYNSIDGKASKYDARKPTKLSGVFICRNLLIFPIRPWIRGPPFIGCEIWWKVWKSWEKFIWIIFLLFRLFIGFVLSSLWKGGSGIFYYGLCRGEVIPFETEPSGKRDCTEKILRLLH